jgi:hypothetical protein
MDALDALLNRPPEDADLVLIKDIISALERWVDAQGGVEAVEPQPPPPPMILPEFSTN